MMLSPDQLAQRAAAGAKVSGPRGPSRDRLVRLEELLDRHLIRVLQDAGEPCRDAEGKPMVDADGRTVRTPISAPLLRVIVERVRDIHAERAAIPRTPEEVAKTLEERAKLYMVNRAGSSLSAPRIAGGEA